MPRAYIDTIFSSNPGNRRLIARNQLRIERPLPVARNAQIELRGLGQHRLLPITVAAVALPRRRLEVQMVIDLRVQDPLRQALLPLVEYPVLRQNSRPVTPRQ